MSLYVGFSAAIISKVCESGRRCPELCELSRMQLWRKIEAYSAKSSVACDWLQRRDDRYGRARERARTRIRHAVELCRSRCEDHVAAGDDPVRTRRRAAPIHSRLSGGM